MRAHDVREDGFTLPELLVAITILGIIIVAIGAMITTAFRTSSTVSAELQGSRAPKTVSRYWVPDAEQATDMTSDRACGVGPVVATFTSPVYASAFDDATYDPNATPTTRTITWTIEQNGQRSQLVRTVCGTSLDRTVVVSDLDATPPDTHKSAPPRYVLTVSVPDRSRPSDIYTFDTAGTSQVAGGTP